MHAGDHWRTKKRAYYKESSKAREEAPEGAMAHAPRWSVTRSRNGALCDALGFAQARRDGGGDT
jgi:hypothetical protein